MLELVPCDLLGEPLVTAETELVARLQEVVLFLDACGS